MTKWQEEAVERIKRYILEHDLRGNDERYEIKEFSVEETDYGTVIVFSVTGLKNNEGTMSSIFGRTRRYIFVDKRGGLRCTKWDSEKKKSIDLRGWTDVMIHGWSH